MSPTWAVSAAPARPRSEAGFTLLELIVAMGLLAGFLLMLVRLLSTGVGLFDEGERGQEMLDRALAASRATRAALLDTSGPRLVGRPTGAADARLLVHHASLGGRQGGARVQVLRSTADLPPALEEQLLAAVFRAEARAAGQDELDAEDTARERLATWPRTGRGELLLLPWPADEEGVFLDLRRGDRPADPLLFAEDEPTLLEIDHPDDLALDPERVLAETRVIARGLLHFELALWSQRTRTWAPVGATGPETVWDSARAGVLTPDPAAGSGFGLDLGPASLDDPRDDVWPRWVRITLVVAARRDAPPDSYLTAPVGEAEQSLALSRPEDLPSVDENPFVKVGAEWVRFGGIAGTSLTGLRRGQRGTRAVPHPTGTPVRAGRLLVLDLALPQGRDADD